MEMAGPFSKHQLTLFTYETHILPVHFPLISISNKV